MTYLAYFNSVPPQLATLIIAMLPVAENRVSVPLALGAYHLPVWQALLFSVMGSVLAAAFVVYGLHLFYRRLQGHLGIIDKLLQKIFDRTERKFMQKYQRWGEIALLVFVAVPLPMTGAWTGALIAFLLGVPIRHSWPYLLGGVIISALITLAVTMGAIRIF